MLNFIVESFERKCKVLESAKDNLYKAENSKATILSKLKDLNSYKAIFEQYN